MDDQRREIQTFADTFQAADIVRIGRGRAPHSRTGGEDLEGVGAKTVSFKAGVFEGFCAGSVDADSQNGYRNSRMDVVSNKRKECSTYEHQE